MANGTSPASTGIILGCAPLGGFPDHARASHQSLLSVGVVWPQFCAFELASWDRGARLVLKPS